MESLDTPLVEMSVLSINYWPTKFGIISGIRRFLAEQKPSEDINPLNTSEKRYDLTGDFKQGTHIVIKLRSCCYGLCFYLLGLRF